LATASVAGAGATRVLPDQVADVARDAIEAVTPVEFDESAGDHTENFGGVVSSDATGESDGEPGVDGSAISEMAPGAAHRPADPGQAPAQTGPSEGTGLDQATEIPAAPYIPDDAGAPEEPPSTTPDTTGGPAQTPPSTVPEIGGPAAGAGGTGSQSG
jgi:hypothetical protein